MDKLNIKIVRVGHFPKDFQQKDILNWHSKIFELKPEIESFHLKENSDLFNWAYSDKLMNKRVPKTSGEDLLLAITNVPLEENYYARRLDNGNRAVVTFHDTHSILEFHNIPLKNFIFRVLYAYSLIFMRCKQQGLAFKQLKDFTHDETRGCLFDMNGNKVDLHYSCSKPVICEECVQRLKDEGVAIETIEQIRSELKKIRKTLFFRALGFVKAHPIWALIISSVWAFLLNIVASLITK